MAQTLQKEEYSVHCLKMGNVSKTSWNDKLYRNEERGIYNSLLVLGIQHTDSVVYRRYSTKSYYKIMAITTL